MDFIGWISHRGWASRNLHHPSSTSGLPSLPESDQKLSLSESDSSPCGRVRALSLGPYPIALQKSFWDWVTILVPPHPSYTKGLKCHFTASKAWSCLLTEDKTRRPQACFVICEIRVSLYLTDRLKDKTGRGSWCVLNGSSGINQVIYNPKISGSKQ